MRRSKAASATVTKKWWSLGTGEERAGQKNKITTLDFRRADFSPFRELLERVLRDRVLEEREVQESWLIFKNHLFQAQEQSVPKSRKSRKNARRPAWMNKEFLAKLKHKKEV